MTYKENALKLM